MAHDVFISYAFEDKPVADAVCARLEQNQIRCWIAPRDIPVAEKFATVIIHAIDHADLIIVIFSSNADKSPHVKSEIEHAFQKEKIIIPFRIESVEPSDEMQFFMGNRHWLDALTPPLEDHIGRLVTVVRKNLGGREEKPQSTGRPDEFYPEKPKKPAAITGKEERADLEIRTKRILAYLVDFGIGLGAGFGVFFMYVVIAHSILGQETYNALMFTAPGKNSPSGDFFFIFTFMIGLLLYLMAFDISRRRKSPGKNLFQVNIIKTGENKIAHWRTARSVVKNLPIIFIIVALPMTYAAKNQGYVVVSVGLFFLFLWGLPILFTKKSQAIHDIIAGTIVRDSGESPRYESNE
jgi:uncharacterized RDD family membrane protein YckC